VNEFWEVFASHEEDGHTITLERERHFPAGCKRIFRMRASRTGLQPTRTPATKRRRDIIEQAQKYCGMFRLDASWLEGIK
jgi:hypothetical protein